MTQSAEKQLFEIVATQHGYFTNRQAISVGYRINNHPYHIKQGHWIREHRGIYRLANFLGAPDDQFAMWTLWSMNNKGEAQGVYSFETALTIYDASDVMPAKLHMTVPKKFRRSSAVPDILVLHFDDLDAQDYQVMSGYRVTTPSKTLLDIIAAETIENHLIQQAADEFRKRGLLTRQDVLMLVEREPKAAGYFINKPKEARA